MNPKKAEVISLFFNLIFGIVILIISIYSMFNKTAIQTVSGGPRWLIPIGIGVTYSISALMKLIKRKKKKKLYSRLKDTGQCVYAQIEKIEVNRYDTVNRRHPYIIFCSWKSPYDGKTHVFKSDNIWPKTTKILWEEKITTLPVYINLENMKEYYVDLEEIENADNNFVDLR